MLPDWVSAGLYLLCNMYQDTNHFGVFRLKVPPAGRFAAFEIRKMLTVSLLGA